MLDDYTSVLRHAAVPAARPDVGRRPRSTGDIRVDAAFAAMAEYLARDGERFAARAEIDADDIILLYRKLGFTTVDEQH